MADQTGPKRTKKQREYDLKEISGLYLQGWIQAEIAAHLAKNRTYQISQQQISADIKAIQKRWLESSIRSFDEARAQELAKIDNLENVYWQQFEASQDPIVKRKTSKRVNRDDDDPHWKTTEATQEISLGTGDPRFLQGVQWCIDKRCKLLGLDAPAKPDINYNVDVSTLSDDQLVRLVNGESLGDVLGE
jgi:hypothetical protein